MNPFFFGPSERPLFGVYTHGQSGSGPNRSVLLCYPMGSEYMRAHRAFRQLNSLLNRAGLNVLRFDYSCTGDSAGTEIEASVDDWIDDIDWAIEELKDNAMAETVSVVGLRWGGTLAALAATRRRDIDHLVLWDPIVSGKRYLDACVGNPRPDDVVGLEGFPLSPRLISQLDTVDLTTRTSGLSAVVTSILVADDRAEYRELDAALRGQDIEPSFRVVPSSGDWGQADPFGDALIPQKIIQVIVDRLNTPIVP